MSVTANLCYSVTKTSAIGDTDIIDNEKDVFGLGFNACLFKFFGGNIDCWSLC